MDKGNSGTVHHSAALGLQCAWEMSNIDGIYTYICCTLIAFDFSCTKIPVFSLQFIYLVGVSSLGLRQDSGLCCTSHDRYSNLCLKRVLFFQMLDKELFCVECLLGIFVPWGYICMNALKQTYTIKTAFIKANDSRYQAYGRGGRCGLTYLQVQDRALHPVFYINIHSAKQNESKEKVTLTQYKHTQ